MRVAFTRIRYCRSHCTKNKGRHSNANNSFLERLEGKLHQHDSYKAITIQVHIKEIYLYPRIAEDSTTGYITAELLSRFLSIPNASSHSSNSTVAHLQPPKQHSSIESKLTVNLYFFREHANLQQWNIFGNNSSLFWRLKSMVLINQKREP